MFAVIGNDISFRFHRRDDNANPSDGNKILLLICFVCITILRFLSTNKCIKNLYSWSNRKMLSVFGRHARVVTIVHRKWLMRSSLVNWCSATIYLVIASSDVICSLSMLTLSINRSTLHYLLIHFHCQSHNIANSRLLFRLTILFTAFRYCIYS